MKISTWFAFSTYIGVNIQLSFWKTMLYLLLSIWYVIIIPSLQRACFFLGRDLCLVIKSHRMLAYRWALHNVQYCLVSDLPLYPFSWLTASSRFTKFVSLTTFSLQSLRIMKCDFPWFKTPQTHFVLFVIVFFYHCWWSHSCSPNSPEMLILNFIFKSLI